jgi:hypothetical protein
MLFSNGAEPLKKVTFFKKFPLSAQGNCGSIEGGKRRAPVCRYFYPTGRRAAFRKKR